MSNPLDRKPIRSALSGKNAKKHQKNRLTQPNQRNLMGLERSDTQRVSRNPLAFPTSRLGLTFRSMQDGVSLIEAIGSALNESRGGVKLAKADPYYGQPDEEPEQPGVLDLEDEEQWPTLQAAAERYGEQKIVQFIYNRHCSRFDPSTTSLADAIDKAWQYHTDEDTILEDFRTVDSYGDLAQYMRP